MLGAATQAALPCGCRQHLRTGQWPSAPLGMAKAPEALRICSGPEHQPRGEEPWCGAADHHRATRLPGPQGPHLASSPLQSVTFCHMLGWGHFARSPDHLAALSQGLEKTALPPHRSLSSPAESVGLVTLPPQPCSPSAVSMGQMPVGGRADGPFARTWEARSHRQCGAQGWGGGCVPHAPRPRGRAGRATSPCVGRASAQQEQAQHSGRSAGLLLGYFFDIF